MSYAFYFTRDLLHEKEPDVWPEPDGCLHNIYVSNGTDDATSKALEKALKEDKKGYMFRLIDDDGIPNFEGRFYDDTDEYSEESLYALFSWGAGYAGTTLLTFPHKKEFEIG